MSPLCGSVYGAPARHSPLGLIAAALYVFNPVTWYDAAVWGQTDSVGALVLHYMLGDPAPWDPLDLPHDDMADLPNVPRDPGLRPSLDEVLEYVESVQGTVGAGV